MDPQLHIFISVNNKIVPMIVDPQLRVNTFKKNLSQQFSLSRRLKVYRNNEPLEGWMRLSDFNIEDNDILDIKTS
jgi:hypothetical protein